MHDLAVARGNGTLRLTTRQTIQFHGVIKSNLRPAIQDIHAAMLDTIAACGDVNRNVIASVVPQHPALHAAVMETARTLSEHLLPKSHAWHELWIDGEQVAGAEEDEPILGRTYLPRKFKIAIAVPPYNDTDAFAHEVGLIAIVEQDRIVGYNVVVGGGMGMTHGEPDTFPRTGDVIGFCTPDQVVQVCEQIVTIQRDWGNRSDRKHARLKYTIERVGLDRFVAELHDRLGFALEPARPYRFERTGDPNGWVEGADGLWHHFLFVENGRVRRRDAGCAAGHRDRTRRPLHPDAEPEPGDRRRARRPESGHRGGAGARRPGCGRARCGAMRWPAWRCRPAAWRWRKANATCRG